MIVAFPGHTHLLFAIGARNDKYVVHVIKHKVVDKVGRARQHKLIEFKRYT